MEKTLQFTYAMDPKKKNILIIPFPCGLKQRQRRKAEEEEEEEEEDVLFIFRALPYFEKRSFQANLAWLWFHSSVWSTFPSRMAARATQTHQEDGRYQTKSSIWRNEKKTRLKNSTKKENTMVVNDAVFGWKWGSLGNLQWATYTMHMTTAH